MVLKCLLADAKQFGNDTRWKAAVKARAVAIGNELPQLQDQLNESPWPFATGHGPVAMGRRVVVAIPSGRDPDAIHRAADEALAAATHVSHRILFRLGYLAEKVESALGLTPIPLED
ncbi:MAG: hypothetical protein KDB53_03555 [Planctomycetes bacterium]|nr:hypothetical protein [Planctomycetota bacterium]